MGLFKFVKFEFNHPIDVNINGPVLIRASDPLINFQIEVINKKPENQYKITQIVTVFKMERKKGVSSDSNEYYQPFITDRQNVDITIPANNTPLYFNMAVANKPTAPGTDALNQMGGGSLIAKSLLAFADTSAVANPYAKPGAYRYRMVIELHDAEGMRGYSDAKVNVVW